MAHADWYRLDNIGKFYAAEAGGNRQTVFRFAAEMADEVDPAALQRALDCTVERYPSFNVCLRSGLFWHYLEPAKGVPQVQPESLPVCFGLHTGPRSVLFRVTWFERRVSLEVSHMISDGRGTLQFFRTLMGFYGQERYGTRFSEEQSEEAAEARGRQAEDSFGRHYDRSKRASGRSERPYRLRGLKDQALPTFMEYHLSAAAVRARAKSMGVSVTSLLIGAVIRAVRASMPARERLRPIKLTVPVDLRQFFDSATMRNFFGLAFVSYVPGLADEPLEKVAAEVQRQIIANCSASAVEGRMNRMIALEKNVGLRLAPLFLKDLALDAAARVADRDVTTTFSSIGVIRLPASVAPHVRSVSVLTSTTGLNFVACTFGDDLSLGISTVFKQLTVIDELQRLLGELGLEGCMVSTRDSAESGGLGKRADSAEEAEEAPKARGEIAGASPSADAASPPAAPATPCSLAPACRNRTGFPAVAANAPAKAARRVLAGVAGAALAGLLLAALLLRLSPWPVALLAVGVLVSWLFLRNVVAHSPDFVRVTERYFLVLLAMAVLWWLQGGSQLVACLVIPGICLAALLMNTASVVAFRDAFVRDYAKYLLYSLVLGLAPLALLPLGAAPWPWLIWASAAATVLLALTLLLLARKQSGAELRKLFNA